MRSISRCAPWKNSATNNPRQRVGAFTPTRIGGYTHMATISVSPASGSRTLADLFAHYQGEYLADKAPHTQYFNKLFFQRVLNDLGPLPLADVTPEVLRTWKLHLSQRCRPGSVRRYMKMLSAPLRAAVEDYH